MNIQDETGGDDNSLEGRVFVGGGWIKALANHPASSLELIEVQYGPYSCCYIPVIVSETFICLDPKNRNIMKYITGGDLIYPVAFPSMLFWAYCLVGAILRHFYKPNLNPNFISVNCTNLPKIVKIGYDEYHFHHQKRAESSILQQDHPIMNMSSHAVK